MRIVSVDISNDKSPPSVFAGYEGEINETLLQVVLPSRMLPSENNEIDSYEFDFETSYGEKLKSNLIYVSDLVGNIISIKLGQQLMCKDKLKFCVACYDLNGNEIIRLGKSPLCTLLINQSPDGEDVTYISPENAIIALNAADQAITARDMALNKVIAKAEVNELGHLIITYVDNTTVDAGYVKGDQGDKGDKGDRGEAGITPTVDLTYCELSLNAQSGQAVAEAIAQAITSALNTGV